MGVTQPADLVVCHPNHDDLAWLKAQAALRGFDVQTSRYVLAGQILLMSGTVRSRVPEHSE